MKPDAVEILRGVRDALLQVIAPDVQTPAVRAQVGYAAALLDQVAQEWDDEGERLGNEIADLRAVFGRVASGLAVVPGGPALAAELEQAAAAETSSMRLSVMQADLDRLRGLLPRLAGLTEVDESDGGLPDAVRVDLKALLHRTAERRRGFGL